MASELMGAILLVYGDNVDFPSMQSRQREKAYSRSHASKGKTEENGTDMGNLASLAKAKDIEILHENAILHAGCGRLGAKRLPPVPHRSACDGVRERQATMILGCSIMSCAIWLIAIAFGH